MYESQCDPVDIESPILSINSELKEYLAAHPEFLYWLHPRKFEELIADLLNDHGCEVELTRPTRDGGVDIYAYIQTQDFEFLTFVECKRWQPGRPVGLAVVQRLYGIQQSDQANMSMIVTTSHFSAPAIHQAEQYGRLMTLTDFEGLKKWLAPYRKQHAGNAFGEGSPHNTRMKHDKRGRSS